MTLMKFLIDYCDFEADYAQFCDNDYYRNGGVFLSDYDWDNVRDYLLWCI